MNDVIEKLLKESTYNILGVPQVDQKKFAQLIVQECAKVCDDIDTEYGGEDVLATWCAGAIKKHFGVKE
jgi:hypothetical protein